MYAAADDGVTAEGRALASVRQPDRTLRECTGMMSECAKCAQKVSFVIKCAACLLAADRGAVSRSPL